MWLNVSNEELPAKEQLPFWAELISRELAPLTLSSTNLAGGFPASASMLDLGSVRVAAFNSPPVYLRRTRADIRRSDPSTYQLTFVSGTPLWISQRRQDSGLVLGAHHHISVRSLHTLFRRQGETMAAPIRRRRLECCHADLTAPRLWRRSIGAIAARWGIVRPADFSRAFRAAYGVTPRELRQAALRALPDARRAASSDK